MSDIKIKFQPTDKVWIIQRNKAVELSVVRVYVDFRSLLSDRLEPVINIKYLLSDGEEHTEDCVFGSKQELIESL